MLREEKISQLLTNEKKKKKKKNPSLETSRFSASQELPHHFT
jgi:hypothetical protein